MIPNKWIEYVGIVVNSIEYKNQRELHILCPELLPLVTGGHTRANIKSTPYEVKHKDVLNGTQYEKKVDLTETIVAEWLGDTSHDVPDIHEGEQVRVLNYAGLDRFWWLPLGRHDYIRRTEHFRVYICDKEQTLKNITDDNTWYLDFDTKYNNKRIKLSTAKSDGEDYRYFFEIDAVKNTVKLWDDSGNYFFLDSSIPKFILRNRANNYIEMDEVDLNINVPRNVTWKVGNDMFFELAGNIYNKVGLPVVTDVPPDDNPSKPNTYTRHPTVPFFPAWVKAPDPIPKPPPVIGGNITSTITQNVKTSIGATRAVDIASNDTLLVNGARNKSVAVGITDSTGGAYSMTAGAVISLTAGADFKLTAGGKYIISAAEIVGGAICKVPLAANRLD